MDARTKKQDSHPAHPLLRTGALALALAAVPAIGAGIQAQETLVPERVAVAPPPAPGDTIEPVATPGVQPAPAPVPEPEVIKVEAPAPIATLEPGEFLWNPEVAPDGPVVVIVSLPEQRLHVYRNGLRIAVSTISSGKPGHSTPTGVFPILQKRVEHYSNLYDDAPMPYMQRLTWGGVALHAGRNPGYPASHGCIRLPHEFAQLLYDVTSHGTTVVVADDSSNSASVVYPGPELPVDPHTGMEPVAVDVAALAQLE